MYVINSSEMCREYFVICVKTLSGLRTQNQIQLVREYVSQKNFLSNSVYGDKSAIANIINLIKSAKLYLSTFLSLYVCVSF